MSYQVNILSPQSSPPSRQNKAFLQPTNQNYDNYPQTIKKSEKNPIPSRTQRKRPDYPNDSLSYLENELDGGRGGRREEGGGRRDDGGGGGRAGGGRTGGRRREEEERERREEERGVRMEVDERRRRDEEGERDDEGIMDGEGRRDDGRGREDRGRQDEGDRWEEERVGRWEEAGGRWEEGGRRKEEGGSLNTKQRYAEELKQQMMNKEVEKQRNKLREQVLENKLLADNDQWFGRQIKKKELLLFIFLFALYIIIFVITKKA